MENLTGGTPPVRYLPCVVPCKLYFAGLIIYLTSKDKTPLKAKSAGKGALIGFIVGIVLSILTNVLAAVFAGVAATSYSGVI